MGDLDASVPVGAPRPRLAQPLAPDSAAVASSGGGGGGPARAAQRTQNSVQAQRLSTDIVLETLAESVSRSPEA